MSWTAPLFDGTGSLRACADESHWTRAARVASARHGLACGEARLFATGSDVVVDCGGHVFKMTAPRWAAEIATEHDLLERVAGRLGLATPEPLAQGELDGWPYVLATRVPGRALAEVWPLLPADERARTVRAIGELMARLHGLPVSDAEAASWPDFRDRMRDGAPERLAATGASEAWRARVAPFLRALGPPSPRRPALLHTELYDQHLLVEETGGRWRLAAVIDFADGRAGHPWYEIPAVVEFVLRGERPLLRELLRGYGLAENDLDEGLSGELLGWSLAHQFCHWRRLLAAAGPPEPESLEELAARLYGLD